MSCVVYKPFTYRKPLPLRTKPCTYYFSTTLAMRAALKSKRTTLPALLSFLERLCLCCDGGSISTSDIAQSSREDGVGWGVRPPSP